MNQARKLMSVNQLKAANSCETCIDDYYLTEAGDCELCPTGTTCTSGKSTIFNLHVKENYWRISETSSHVYLCPKQGSCNVSGFCAQGKFDELIK